MTHPTITDGTSTSANANSRLNRLRAKMAEQGLDAIVTFKPQNTFFLSGFNPVFYSHPVVVIVPLDADPILLVHALRDEHAASASTVRDIRLYGAWGDKITMGMSWSRALSEIIYEIGGQAGRIGLDQDFISLQVLRTVEAAVPAAKFTDASDLLFYARMVKDADQIEALRIACALTDRAMEAAVPVIADRGTEREVAVAAVSAMQQAWLGSGADYEIVDFANNEGAVHSGLASYCLAGDRVSRNADGPTNRRIVDGELAMIFTFATCDGMHAEQERCVAVGDVDSRVLHAYDTFLQARQAMFDGLRPGLTCAGLYGLAAPVYEERGYGSNMPGRMGHGIGLGTHEEPSIAPDVATVLVPGMAITIEPNLRIPLLNGGGGQHSDTVIITEDGFEFLTNYRREMIRV